MSNLASGLRGILPHQLFFRDTQCSATRAWIQVARYLIMSIHQSKKQYVKRLPKHLIKETDVSSQGPKQCTSELTRDSTPHQRKPGHFVRKTTTGTNTQDKQSTSQILPSTVHLKTCTSYREFAPFFVCLIPSLRPMNTRLPTNSAW